MNRMMVALGSSLAVVALASQASGPTNVRVDAERLARVVEEVEGLRSLRSRLAESFTGEPDQSTFARVCKPVGERPRELSREHGWSIQQLAERYRNPAHRLDPEAQRVSDMMERDPGLMGLWLDTEVNGKPGVRYFRRIVVEEACLACHGPRDARPEFIKRAYPEDRAYDFDVGDLRGLYAVFVPES